MSGGIIAQLKRDGLDYDGIILLLSARGGRSPHAAPRAGMFAFHCERCLYYSVATAGPGWWEAGGQIQTFVPTSESVQIPTILMYCLAAELWAGWAVGGLVVAARL